MLLSVVGVWPPHDAAKERLAGHNLYHVLEATAADSASLTFVPARDLSVGIQPSRRSDECSQPSPRSHRRSLESSGERRWRQGMALIPLVNRSDLQGCDHAEAIWFDHRNGVLVRHMLSRITASFRATATRAFLIPCRAAIRSPHRLTVDHPEVRASNVVAASYNAVRVAASPALVI